MSSVPLYPLQQVIGIKKKRVDEQERVVKEKKRLLAEEEEKLKKAEEERDKVKQHRDDKLAQLREALDNAGLNPEKILQMRAYLKIVKANLETEEEKVKKQEEQVKTAEKNVEEAKAVLKQKELEVDKLKTHRKEWLKEAMKEVERKEAAEQDELGSLAYIKRQKEQL